MHLSRRELSGDPKKTAVRPHLKGMNTFCLCVAFWTEARDASRLQISAAEKAAAAAYGDRQKKKKSACKYLLLPMLQLLLLRG